jgi:hypothetical protein
MFAFNHHKASYSWLSCHYMGALQPLPHSYKNSEHEVISNPGPGPVVTYSDAERDRIPFVARSTEIPMDPKTVMHCCMLRIEEEGAMNCLETKCKY